MSSADAVSPLDQAKRFKREVDRAVNGQWETALSALAPDLADAIEQGLRRSPRHVPCPVHGGKDGFRLFADWRDSGGAVCNSCGKFGDGFALLMWLHGRSFADTVRRVGDVFGVQHPADTEPRRNTGGTQQKAAIAKPLENPVRTSGTEKAYRPFDGYANGLWDEAEPITVRNLGGKYLQSRNCVLPPEDGDLRFHPRLEHKLSGYVGPALLARITDIETNEPISLHRTWLDEEGRKAPIEKPRLPLSGYRKGGGCIRIWPDDAVATGLGVAEGIESALSLAHAFQPVWSLIDAGNLKALPVLAGIDALTIAADNDPAGLSASIACATRWTEAGREVRVICSLVEGEDLNDLAVAA